MCRYVHPEPRTVARAVPRSQFTTRIPIGIAKLDMVLCFDVKQKQPLRGTSVIKVVKLCPPLTSFTKIKCVRFLLQHPNP